MWLTAEAWRLELRLVSCVGGRRCFLAARENDSQRRGRPAGFGSKTHKAGERFWGRKQRKRWLLVWGVESCGLCRLGEERISGVWAVVEGKMGADVQDVGMALGSGQGRGLEAAVKGKNNGQPEGLCCWLEKMGEGWRLGEDEIGLGLLFPSSDVVKIAPPSFV